MTNNKLFYKWFVAFCLIVSTFALAFYEGVIKMMVEADVSRLGIVILGLFFLVSIFTGVQAWFKGRGEKVDTNHRLKIVDFCKGHFFTLGILGTIVGLIYMTNNVLDGTDTQKIIVGLKDGLATALYTTAAGIVSSVLTSIQLFILQYDDRDENQ